MDILIKLAPGDYERLRSQIPSESPARAAIETATPIDHSIEGVLFEGYNLACDEEQARIILHIAKHCCPEITPETEKAIMLARSS